MADFDFEIKNFDPKAVKSEDEAFAILLRFEPEPYIRYLSLLPHDENAPPRHLNEEDTNFLRDYRAFMRVSYGEYAPYNLNDAYQYAKELSAWAGDFTEYSQTLHDAGLIFKSEIYTELKKHGIEPVYSETSTARRYYQLRARDGLWPLDTAVKLYLGYARDGKKLFRILDERPRLISTRLICDQLIEGQYAYMDKCGSAGVIAEFVAEQLEARNIEAYRGSFRPREITKFLSDHFPDTYCLEVLFEALKINVSEKNRAEEDTLRCETDIATRSKQKREHELHNLIGTVIVELEFQNKTAPANKVWNHIKKNKEKYECIDEVTDTEIKWFNYRYLTRTMKRERFNTVVSEYNTRKRQYPDASNHG